MPLGSDPALLLRIDAAGALVTCLMTGAVFATDRGPTGLPVAILVGMAVAAAVLCLLGLTGLTRPARQNGTLRLLAVLNALFCIVSALIWMRWWGQLTMWGVLYFPLEVMVVLALAVIEWRATAAPVAQWSDAG